MCGSGTFLIEGAMIAMNIAPGIHRKRFGFMNWLNFDDVATLSQRSYGSRKTRFGI